MRCASCALAICSCAAGIEEVAVTRAAKPALVAERRREVPDCVVVELALRLEQVREPLHRAVLHAAGVDDVVGLPPGPVRAGVRGIATAVRHAALVPTEPALRGR